MDRSASDRGVGLTPATQAWLLDGDPAVVWRTQRDLLDRAPRTWKATRRRVATEGWGARLLALRASDGTWGGGLYSPKWTSTFYTMRLLTHLGLPPTDRSGVMSADDRAIGFALVDKDSDGAVSYDELAEWWSIVREEAS